MGNETGLMQAEGWGLILSFSGLFPTKEEEHAFVHGVEFGQLWVRMRSGNDAEIRDTFHVANTEVIRRACVQQGWDCTIAPCLSEGEPVDGWIDVKMTKRSSERHNPHGLQVVR